jgi:hypothetical protein
MKFMHEQVGDICSLSTRLLEIDSSQEARFILDLALDDMEFSLFFNLGSKACAPYNLSIACEKNGDVDRATKSWAKAELVADRFIDENRHLRHLKDAVASTKFISLLRTSTRFSESAPAETVLTPNHTAQKCIEYQPSEIHTLGAELDKVTLTSQTTEVQYLTQPSLYSGVLAAVGSGLTEMSLPIVDLPRPGNSVPMDLPSELTSLSLPATALTTIEKAVCATVDASTTMTSSVVTAVAVGVAAAVLGIVNTTKTFQQVHIAERAANVSERSAAMAEKVGKKNLKLINLQIKEMEKNPGLRRCAGVATARTTMNSTLMMMALVTMATMEMSPHLDYDYPRDQGAYHHCRHNVR